jgi:hypothetical protein
MTIIQIYTTENVIVKQAQNLISYPKEDYNILEFGREVAMFLKAALQILYSCNTTVFSQQM